MHEIYNDDESIFSNESDNHSSRKSLPTYNKHRILREKTIRRSKPNAYRYRKKIHKHTKVHRRRKLETKDLVQNVGYGKWYHYPQLPVTQNENLNKKKMKTTEELY